MPLFPRAKSEPRSASAEASGEAAFGRERKTEQKILSPLSNPLLSFTHRCLAQTPDRAPKLSGGQRKRSGRAHAGPKGYGVDDLAVSRPPMTEKGCSTIQPEAVGGSLTQEARATRCVHAVPGHQISARSGFGPHTTSARRESRSVCLCPCAG